MIMVKFMSNDPEWMLTEEKLATYQQCKSDALLACKKKC